jgi:hypothetical protein
MNTTVKMLNNTQRILSTMSYAGLL